MATVETGLSGVYPFNFVIDLFWMTADPSRQALRDKFAHTYVIRKGATPAGTGDIVLSTYTVAGSTFLFREVKRPKGDAQSDRG